jgi:hypothetical protein
VRAIPRGIVGPGYRSMPGRRPSATALPGSQLATEPRSSGTPLRWDGCNRPPRACWRRGEWHEHVHELGAVRFRHRPNPIVEATVERSPWLSLKRHVCQRGHLRLGAPRTQQGAVLGSHQDHGVRTQRISKSGVAGFASCRARHPPSRALDLCALLEMAVKRFRRARRRSLRLSWAAPAFFTDLVGCSSATSSRLGPCPLASTRP